MQTATLTITRTSPECAAYRLTDGAGRVVWSNRVYDVPQGHAGARERLAAWAVQHGYRTAQPHLLPPHGGSADSIARRPAQRF